MSNATNDRAVQALIAAGWSRPDTPVAALHLARGVAVVLCVVRDDMLNARNAGDREDITDVAHWLSSRVMALTGNSTSTGDTTV